MFNDNGKYVMRSNYQINRENIRERMKFRYTKCPLCGKNKMIKFEFCHSCRSYKSRKDNGYAMKNHKFYCQYLLCPHRLRENPLETAHTWNRYLFCTRACMRKFKAEYKLHERCQLDSGYQGTTKQIVEEIFNA